MNDLINHIDFARFFILLAYVFVLGFFFAKVEIQVEGAEGWAVNLPTWRIEQHILLTIFWGGRAMTGYHAWVFTFIAIIFHFPAAVIGHWSWMLELRVIASVMLFWVIEDFLWFILNPGFGLKKFNKEVVTWHPNWVLGAPIEYWGAIIAGLALMGYSYYS